MEKIGNFYKNKKVLVTGGTGLIGRPLVKLLLEEGAIVTVASLDDPSRCPDGASFKRVDLREFNPSQKWAKESPMVKGLVEWASTTSKLVQVHNKSWRQDSEKEWVNCLQENCWIYGTLGQGQLNIEAAKNEINNVTMIEKNDWIQKIVEGTMAKIELPKPKYRPELPEETDVVIYAGFNDILTN